MAENCFKPYIFQSGKYKNLSIEEVILKDPAYIGVLLRYAQSSASGNGLHKHLSCLCDFPRIQVDCPVCHKKRVRYFLYLNTTTISRDLICCDNPECQKILKANHPNDYLLPLKLSSLMIFKGKGLSSKFISLLKNLTGLKEQSKAEEILDVFINEKQLSIKF